MQSADIVLPSSLHTLRFVDIFLNTSPYSYRVGQKEVKHFSALISQHW